MSKTLTNSDILFHDNHVLALRKSVGLATQPSQHHVESLEDAGKAWLKSTLKKPGNVYLHAVHRLDRLASGIVLFACTSKALSRLNAALRARQLQKTYRIIVEGRPARDRGTLIDALVHANFRACVAPAGAVGAKEARLDYAVGGAIAGLSLIEVRLLTGRYHQIRVQFAARGCPVVGDRKYGATQPRSVDGIALHHAKLTFPHPVRREPITLTCPLPDGWPWDRFVV